MNFPIGIEEGRYILVREKVWRTVRSVNDAYFPLVVEVRAQGVRHTGARHSAGTAVQMQDVAGTQGAAVVPAEFTEGKGRLGTQVVRALHATEHAQVGAGAGFLDAAQGQGLASGNIDDLPQGNGLIIQSCVQRRTAEHDLGRLGETQRRALQGDFQARSVFGVVQQTIAEPEGITIKRPGGRHAHIPATGAAGKILNGGLGAAGQHVNACRAVAKAVQIACGHFTGSQHRIATQRTQIIEVGFAAIQAGGVQRALQLAQCLLAGVSMHNHLGQHGIKVSGYFQPGFDPMVDANAVT